jgi:hypothetical protein
MNPNLTDITLLIDKSSSMAPLAKVTVEGINNFLAEQAKQPGEATLTIVQFNTRPDTTVFAAPLKTVPLLTLDGYQPSGGTALLDAMGTAMELTGKRLAAMPEANRPGKVLFVVMTDGEENSSREYSHLAIKTMIQHQQEKYGWTFVYLGANQDAIQVAASYGIDEKFAKTFNATEIGTQTEMAELSQSVIAYRSTGDFTYQNK